MDDLINRLHLTLEDAQTDKSILRFIGYSAFTAVVTLTLASQSPNESILIPASAFTSGISALTAFLKNQTDKDAQLYYRLLREAQDNLFADFVTTEETVRSTEIKNSLLQRLSELKQQENTILDKLAEFEAQNNYQSPAYQNGDIESNVWIDESFN